MLNYYELVEEKDGFIMSIREEEKRITVTYADNSVHTYLNNKKSLFAEFGQIMYNTSIFMH